MTNLDTSVDFTKENINRRIPARSKSIVARRDFLKSSLVALATPFFLCCEESSPTEINITDPIITAKPGTPSLTPVIGSSQLGLAKLRDGILYVPQSYSPETPAPLFVALHGAGGSGGNWGSYYARCEARGMILLAPDSRSTTWDLIEFAFGPDIQFLNRALRYVFERCLVDPEQIVLGGFSDGASYALSLGLSNGDLFKYLIGYSPGFAQRYQPVVGKPRIFISHGTRDTVLPVTLSRNTIVPNLTNAGYEVTYREFDGGHEVPADITEAALDWFLGVN